VQGQSSAAVKTDLAPESISQAGKHRDLSCLECRVLSQRLLRWWTMQRLWHRASCAASDPAPSLVRKSHWFPIPTEAQAELSQLLNRQSELALDLSPEGERAYAEIVAQIALMTPRVEHEKQESSNA